MSLINPEVGDIEGVRKTSCFRRYVNTEKQINVLIGGYHFLICSGIIVGWLLYNPKLTTEDWLAEGTELEGFIVIFAWFSGIIVGGLHAGYYIDDMGRKNTFLCSGLMYIVGASVMIAFQNAIVSIVIGLMALGYAHGAIYVSLLAYVGEISSKENRGLIMTTLHFTFVLGIFIFQIMLTFADNFDSDDTNFVLRLIIILITIIGILFSYIYMPESPVYLLIKDDIQGAGQVLTKLRCNEDDNLKTNTEFRDLQKFVDDDLKLDMPTVFKSKALHLFGALKVLAVVLFNYPFNLTRIVDLSYEIDDLQMNYFFTILARLMGALMAIILIEIMSRRRLYQTLMLLTSVTVIVMVVLNLTDISIIIPTICFELISSAGLLQLIDIYSTEAFSSSKRGKGLSLIVFYENLIQLGLAAIAMTINKPSAIGKGDINDYFKSGTLIITMILIFIFNFLNVPETKNLPLVNVRKEVEIGVTFKKVSI